MKEVVNIPDDGAQGYQAYDNWPLNVRQIDPAKTKYHWRVPIEKLPPEERDKRVLEAPMERILELCAKNPPMPHVLVKHLVAKRDTFEAGSPEYNETVGAIATGAIRLCVYLAKKQRRTHMSARFGMDMSDLVQEGYTGALGAARRMDPAKMRHPKMTSTYLSKWISQGISRSIANQSRIVRLPVHVHEKHRNIIYAESQLAAEFGRTPTDYEVACAIHGPVPIPGELAYEDDESFDAPYSDRRIAMARKGYEDAVRETEKEIREFRAIERRTSSLSIPGIAKRTDELHNDPNMEIEVIEQIQADMLMEIIESLPDKKRDVILLYYFEGMTLDQIGSQLGMSRETVRETEAAVLKVFRKYLTHMY